MLRRLVRWDVFRRGEYIMVDQAVENIDFASTWIPQWAAEAGMKIEADGRRKLRVFDAERDMRIQLEQADVFDFIGSNPPPADVLLANAVLDLLPMPSSMPKVLSLTSQLAWLTINFDGVTTLEPVIDAALDARIERLYHESMDARASGGDSKSGRHLFARVHEAGGEILAAGASDWVVHAVKGKYPEDEAYFLHCILAFFEESLAGNPELDARALEGWLKERRLQIERGDLVYIAHQMDVLAKVKPLSEPRSAKQR